ncbi:MAG: DUF7533 family protein [Natronomonas sp.]
MGILRSAQLVATLVVAGPIGLVGVFNLLDGNLPQAIVFLGLALGLVVLSEYVYLRITDRTIGRLSRLRSGRGSE